MRSKLAQPTRQTLAAPSRDSNGGAGRRESDPTVSDQDLLALGRALWPALELAVEHLAAQIAARLPQLETAASPWMDIPMAADYLAISTEGLRKMVSRRSVPFHQERRGGRVFLHRRELDDWLQSI
jgi:excisionase family DNA binding protein